MPCGLGFHPYFPCTAQTELATSVDHVWTVDAAILPVERVPAIGRYDVSGGPVCGRSLDNGYDGWSGEARIRTPGAPFALRMSSPDAGFFQLYSPGEGGLFVAEPVSHANAALNAPEADWPALGLRVLAPGEGMRMRMRIEVEPV
jgi:aldose 1-epimerase